MHGIVVSLNDNLLKVTVNDPEGFRGGSKQLDAALVAGSSIVNMDLFADRLLELITEVAGPKAVKLPMHYLVEPQDVYLHFVTVPKSTGNLEEQVQAQIAPKLKGASFEELYFSYQKIAPFVYQFVGIKKQLLDQYIKLSVLVGNDLVSVVSWITLFPKQLKDNDPAVFISKSNGSQVVALSELNGIYFSGAYTDTNSTEDLQKLVQELSVYKRSKPIKRVFTLNHNNFKLDGTYSIEELSLPTNELFQDGEYKLHLLLDSVVSSNDSLLGTQINLLNLLPLPPEEKRSSFVYIGVFAASLLLALGGFGTYWFFLRGSNTGEVAGDSGDSGMLIDAKDSIESTQAVKELPPIATIEPLIEEEVSEDITLDKENLKIRIENGAGIAGVAGSTQATLVELGYDVVSIGNADGQSRDNTLMRFKTNQTKYRNLLIADLKDDFEIVFEDGLSEDEDYDVLLIIGKN